MPERKASCTVEGAGDIAAKLYGIEARLTPLPGEWDANFRAETEGGEAFILKLMRPGCDRGLVELQCAMLERLAVRAPLLRVPRVCKTVDGESVANAAGENGEDHLVWMLRYVQGRPLVEARPHPPELLASLGRMLGELDRALEGFEHPAAHRDLSWDLARAGWIGDHLGAIPDEWRHSLVETFLVRYRDEVVPRLAGLRAGIIHNDANDHNVLVDEPARWPCRVVGLVDFGDSVFTPIVCEVAVGVAYALLGEEDPLAAACAVASGYHAVHPLLEEEIEVLFPLACMRLCVSVVTAALRAAEWPDDPYVTISEAPAWAALERLAEVHPRFARYALRHACGLEPVPGSLRLAQWLAERRDTFAPVLADDPRHEPCVVLDLGVGSRMLGANPAAAQTPALNETLRRSMAAAGATIGVGPYDQARLLNTAAQFAKGPHPSDERRTVHIGLDLFVEPGTAVFAPLDGVVHACANNDRDQDWGPVVILGHDFPSGGAFYTLYGHLDAASTRALRPGQKVVAGKSIGRVGAPPANGNWPPHLHLQIVTDLLDLDTDFPGVVFAAQRGIWRSLCPDPNLIAGIPAKQLGQPAPSREETLVARRAHLGPNLSLSYREPLKIVRGWMQFLYDEEGRAYLDCYNNVAHVGHSHPRVVRAVQEQIALLNTNTRYLHDNLARYAARLVAILPAPLEVCFVLNSASEANELALRLARAHTGREDVIVLEAAYHGHTTSLIDISPYKFAGPGGRGAKPWVHVAPIADDYRGPYRRDDPDAGHKYAEHVGAIAARLTAEGRGPAAFIAETLPSAAGQIVFPPGYLAYAYEHVRAGGGVCVADEVQVGFGRLGSHFWGFETQGVVPDVVVLGKPIGNGFPVAAVVTTREIAASFDNGMEFFSTFGGNPVACAAGMAVLDVIEEDGLQERARRLGGRLLADLREVASSSPVIGDVRGMGLFLGVELVRDRDSLEPAAAEAAYVVDRLRERGILTGTDGPWHNVIKIRPPLIIEELDVERFLAVLADVLQEDFIRFSRHRA
jgi:4-aminobutyrate aminotransferase-like enzyme/Ser/Thr protein kinase RdoA (MazF antagonist)